MNTAELLTDGFGRVRELVASTAQGRSAEQLAQRPNGTGNSIAWLLWHIGRVEDVQVADAFGAEPVYTAQGFARRFGLPFADSAIGYGMSSADVDKVRVEDPQLLVDYYEAVHASTVEHLSGMKDADLDRVVDDNWDPPVTLGVRLISVLGDVTQHIGQAAYARGIVS